MAFPKNFNDYPIKDNKGGFMPKPKRESKAVIKTSGKLFYVNEFVFYDFEEARKKLAEVNGEEYKPMINPVYGGEKWLTPFEFCSSQPALKVKR